MEEKHIGFYDLPNGAFFKGVYVGLNGLKVDKTIYHKTSQGTAHDDNNPGITYYASDFYAVVQVERPITR